MNTLPAGYVDLGYAAMHVSELRKHTADINRFQKYLPLAVEISATEPFSDESWALFDKTDCAKSLAQTCVELGKLALALGVDDLEGGA